MACSPSTSDCLQLIVKVKIVPALRAARCVRACACFYVCAYVCMYVCMYVRMYVCLYVCMYVLCECMYCKHVFIYLLIYLYVSIFIQWPIPVAARSKAAARLEPEKTQHNSLDRLQTRKYKSNTLLLMSAATLKPTVWRQQSEFVSSRQSGQIPVAVCIGFECSCNGQNLSTW